MKILPIGKMFQADIQGGIEFKMLWESNFPVNPIAIPIFFLVGSVFFYYLTFIILGLDSF